MKINVHTHRHPNVKVANEFVSLKREAVFTVAAMMTIYFVISKKQASVPIYPNLVMTIWSKFPKGVRPLEITMLICIRKKINNLLKVIQGDLDCSRRDNGNSPKQQAFRIIFFCTNRFGSIPKFDIYSKKV